MSAGEDDDDIIFIEESSSVSMAKRSPPQRTTHEESTPSNCITLDDDSPGDDAKLAHVESFSRLLSLEQLIEARKSMHEIEHVPVLESMDTQIQPLPLVHDEEFGEASEEEKGSGPPRRFCPKFRLRNRWKRNARLLNVKSALH